MVKQVNSYNHHLLPPPLLLLSLFLVDGHDGVVPVHDGQEAEYAATDKCATHASQVTFRVLLLKPAFRIDQRWPSLDRKHYSNGQLPALQDYTHEKMHSRAVMPSPEQNVQGGNPTAWQCPVLSIASTDNQQTLWFTAWLYQPMSYPKC